MTEFSLNASSKGGRHTVCKACRSAGRKSTRVPMLDVLATLIRAETDDCVLWPHGKTKAGYGVVHDGPASLFTHVVACTFRNGPRPSPLHEAAHGCGRAACINPRHLRWASHTENVGDKRGHGTVVEGERHHAVKMTAELVIEIRRRCTEGVPMSALAQEYQVARSTVSDIVHRATWKHV